MAHIDSISKVWLASKVFREIELIYIYIRLNTTILQYHLYHIDYFRYKYFNSAFIQITVSSYLPPLVVCIPLAPKSGGDPQQNDAHPLAFREGIRGRVFVCVDSTSVVRHSVGG